MPNEMLPYRVRVTVEIVTEDDLVVNHRGYPANPRTVAVHRPWRTTNHFTGSHDIDAACAEAHKVWSVIDAVAKLREH